MQLNLLTQQEFEAFEARINAKFVKLFEMIELKNTSPNQTANLSVKQVTEEFSQSAHIQREARTKGYLPFISGTKEVRYHRQDVEAWIMSRTVR
jgi:hypothetical protein